MAENRNHVEWRQLFGSVGITLKVQQHRGGERGATALAFRVQRDG